jgi:hypothetical protein
MSQGSFDNFHSPLVNSISHASQSSLHHQLQVPSNQQLPEPEMEPQSETSRAAPDVDVDNCVDEKRTHTHESPSGDRRLELLEKCRQVASHSFPHSKNDEPQRKSDDDNIDGSDTFVHEHSASGPNLSDSGRSAPVRQSQHPADNHVEVRSDIDYKYSESQGNHADDVAEQGDFDQLDEEEVPVEHEVDDDAGDDQDDSDEEMNHFDDTPSIEEDQPERSDGSDSFTFPGIRPSYRFNNAQHGASRAAVLVKPYTRHRQLAYFGGEAEF